MNTITVLGLSVWWFAVGVWVHHMWIRCKTDKLTACEALIVVVMWPGIAIVMLLKLIHTYLVNRKY
jgi:hypothetical protein